LEKFVFLTDLHYGYQRKGGHKMPLHDVKALKVALDFVKDFKPDHIILGGDLLDCGAISHHNQGKPDVSEGLKLEYETKVIIAALIKPCEAAKPKTLTYIIGNHEAWVEQFVEKHPSLEGILDVNSILGLSN